MNSKQLTQWICGVCGKVYSEKERADNCCNNMVFPLAENLSTINISHNFGGNMSIAKNILDKMNSVSKRFNEESSQVSNKSKAKYWTVKVLDNCQELSKVLSGEGDMEQALSLCKKMKESCDYVCWHLEQSEE